MYMISFPPPVSSVVCGGIIQQHTAHILQALYTNFVEDPCSLSMHNTAYSWVRIIASCSNVSAAACILFLCLLV